MPPDQSSSAPRILPLLIGLDAVCELTSLSLSSVKRLAKERPDLTVRVNRRLLFHRPKLEAWIEAGCPPECGRRARRGAK